jgi:hypothetical protein
MALLECVALNTVMFATKSASPVLLLFVVPIVSSVVTMLTVLLCLALFVRFHGRLDDTKNAVALGRDIGGNPHLRRSRLFVLRNAINPIPSVFVAAVCLLSIVITFSISLTLLESSLDLLWGCATIVAMVFIAFVFWPAVIVFQFAVKRSYGCVGKQKHLEALGLWVDDKPPEFAKEAPNLMARKKLDLLEFKSDVLFEYVVGPGDWAPALDAFDDDLPEEAEEVVLPQVIAHPFALEEPMHEPFELEEPMPEPQLSGLFEVPFHSVACC